MCSNCTALSLSHDLAGLFTSNNAKKADVCAILFAEGAAAHQPADGSEDVDSAICRLAAFTAVNVRFTEVPCFAVVFRCISHQHRGANSPQL